MSSDGKRVEYGDPEPDRTVVLKPATRGRDKWAFIDGKWRCLMIPPQDWREIHPNWFPLEVAGKLIVDEQGRYRVAPIQ